MVVLQLPSRLLSGYRKTSPRKLLMGVTVYDLTHTEE